jgi:hypothetical protein
MLEPLPEIMPTVLDVYQAESPSPDLGKLQRELDQTTGQIAEVLDAERTSAGGYEIVNISTALDRFRVGSAALKAGQSLDLIVEVTQPLTTAGLYLSFGGGLDFAPGSSAISLLIEGAVGARELSFVSGTSLADVAAAINTFRLFTGLDARVSGTGVTLRSTRFGSGEFVSVEVTGTPFVDLENAGGIYQLVPGPEPVADTESGQKFRDGLVVLDRGADLHANMNGVKVSGVGTLLAFDGSSFDAQLDLEVGPLASGETANATNPGVFRAFTVVYSDDPLSPLRPIPDP